MNIRRFVGIGAATLAMTALLVACGDSDDNDSSGNNDTSTEVEDTVSSSISFTAHDIEFEETEVSADAGKVEVTLKNEGAIEHSWVVEDHEADLRLHVEKTGDEDDGTITLDSGEYTYYCDIPGHREAGMEGTLKVS
ncbi:MAG: cupredoxin domain-containing protein [Acidimicrobiia bacterium]